MKWNIYFTIRSPDGTTEVPNNTNPVGSLNMASLLEMLRGNVDNIPFVKLEIIGLRIELKEN